MVRPTGHQLRNPFAGLAPRPERSTDRPPGRSAIARDCFQAVLSWGRALPASLIVWSVFGFVLLAATLTGMPRTAGSSGVGASALISVWSGKRSATAVRMRRG